MATVTEQWFLLHWGTSLGATVGQVLKCRWCLCGGLRFIFCHLCALHTSIPKWRSQRHSVRYLILRNLLVSVSELCTPVLLLLILNSVEGYGMRQPCGHVDFYPNNGKEQPGCDLTETPLPLTLIRDGIEEASRVLVACNHIRAIKLFIDSINSKCPYVAHRCDSYQHFLQVSC